MEGNHKRSDPAKSDGLLNEPRASNDMEVTAEYFKAFSRIFVLKKKRGGAGDVDDEDLLSEDGGNDRSNPHR